MSLVREFMITDPVPCTPLTRLEEIERLMHEQKCSEISVLDSLYEKRLVGIVTDSDIESRARIEGVELSHLNAEQCMNTLPIAVNPDSQVEDCLRLMESSHISRMPVVDSDGHYCGVITRSDIQHIK
ncbi:MAG: CBS domain-containing protein [Bacteriovorax sp.]